MAVRDIVNEHGDKIGELELPDDTTEEDWAAALSNYILESKPITQVVYDRLAQYESLAPALLREIKTSNTLAGITSAQSAQVFSDYQTILLAIREGAFPTALYLLQNAQPSGFVTQLMIDDMIARIQSKM